LWAPTGIPLLLTDANNEYVYGLETSPLAQIDTTTGEATYLHTDQLGSVCALTVDTGDNIADTSYNTFGAPTTSSVAAITPFGYAGEYTDTETGLQYLRARYNDHAAAQFLTRDPLEDQTRAAYSYAGGNPVTNTDPTGLFCVLGTNDDGSCRGAQPYNWAVQTLDPVSYVLPAYAAEIDAVNQNCSGWTVFKLGTRAVGAVAVQAAITLGGGKLAALATRKIAGAVIARYAASRAAMAASRAAEDEGAIRLGGWWSRSLSRAHRSILRPSDPAGSSSTWVG
jgi:RHS repeat-associated protein